jgi:hypothetical protein
MRIAWLSLLCLLFGMALRDTSGSDSGTSPGIENLLQTGDKFSSIAACRTSVNLEQGHMGRTMVAKKGNSGASAEYLCTGADCQAMYKFTKDAGGSLVLRGFNRDHGECSVTLGNDIHILAKDPAVILEVASGSNLSTKQFNEKFAVSLESKQKHDLYAQLFKELKKKNDVSYQYLIAQVRHITTTIAGTVIKLTFRKADGVVELVFGDPAKPPPAPYQCGAVNGSTFETMGVATAFGGVMTKFTDIATFDGTVMKTDDGIL